MAEIHTEKRPNLTIYTVTGKLQPEDVLGVFKAFYPDNITRHVVWDLRKASLTQLVLEDLVTGADYIKPHAHLREGGRNAFVVNAKLRERVGRLLSLSLTVTNNPLDVRVFSTTEDACAWIHDDDCTI